MLYSFTFIRIDQRKWLLTVADLHQLEVFLVDMLVVTLRVRIHSLFIKSNCYFLAPEGVIIPPNTNVLGLGFPSIPGSNLPNVDPNNYPGTVHFGPSTTIVGPESVQFPVNTGFVDPNLGVIEAPVFRPGF